MDSRESHQAWSLEKRSGRGSQKALELIDLSTHMIVIDTRGGKRSESRRNVGFWAFCLIGFQCWKLLKQLRNLIT